MRRLSYRPILRGLALLCLPAIVAVLVPQGGQGQQLGQPVEPQAQQILTTSPERLYSESQFGLRMEREVEAESAVLAAENRRIEAELMTEERDLTDRRPSMDPDAFRTLADAFDEKVQATRQEQGEKTRALAKRSENNRVLFFQSVRPVLETLMVDAGAGVILERSSVFLSANATDVTDEAVQRINSALGDGRGLTDRSDR